MVRHFRLLLTAVIAAIGIFMVSSAVAQPVVHVSGRLETPYNPLVPIGSQNNTPTIRVLSADTLYQVSGDYIIGRLGVLVIAPATHIQFLPNGRIVDSASGKIIADGTVQITQFDFTPPSGSLVNYCTTSYMDSKINALNQDGKTKSSAGGSLNQVPYYFSMFYASNGLPGGVTCSTPYRNPAVNRGPIIFEGVPVNSNSLEWGNILILPGADSTFFRNCQFTNFRKDTTVESRTNLYFGWDQNPKGWARLLAKSNGTGAAITTFSKKTYLRFCTFRNNVARLKGGAVAFLQFIPPAQEQPIGSPLPPVIPASLIPADDGRLSISAHWDPLDVNTGTQVNNLTFVGNQVINNFPQHAPFVPPSTIADSLNLNDCNGGAVYIAGMGELGDYTTYRLAVTIGGVLPIDRWVFSSNSAINNQVSGANTFGARGGAIYVDSLTALTIYNGTFLSNYASTPNNDGSTGQIQKMSFGGAIFADSVLNLLTNTFVSGNTAGYGGGVYVSAKFDKSIPPKDITDRRYLQIGGLISAFQAGQGIVFSANTARYYGGAVYTGASSNIVSGNGVDESNNLKVLFDGNRAGQAGGAIYSSNVMSMVNWTKFIRDTVRAYDASPLYHSGVLGGGAICATSQARVSGTDFILNRADSGNGGAIYLSNPPAVNRVFKDSSVVQTPGADTLADQRELTRFIQNVAVRDTSDNTKTGRLQKSGLGGGVYITVAGNLVTFARTDSTFFGRVRFEQNKAYSGAAVYSDLYDMRIVMSRCLVTNNWAISPIERNRDTISGISSKIASAILYGEFEGPLPSYSGSYRGNAVYDNDARFVFRLPDSPTNLGNSGAGGADTLRGNFWGDGTNDANGGIKGSPNVRVSQYNPLIPVNTFFVGTLPNTCLLALPVESEPTFAYNPVPIGQIPDTLLFEGRVYDLLDKGTDIKTADYNDRINTPIEDLAIGGPRYLKSNLGPGLNQNVRRLTRDPYLTDVNTDYAKYQTDFIGDHPLGYPLFLQAFGDAGTDVNRTNFDPYSRNFLVYYIYNKTTNEVVRLNLKETDVATNEYRGRLDFVPDLAGRDTLARRNQENRPIYDVLQLGPMSRTELTLDDRISAASRYNDSVALGGRRVEGDERTFGSGDFSYSNYPAPPLFVRYYSGERYNAISVLTGDQILVFSRSVLFHEGFPQSLSRGLQFSIGNVKKPAMSGYNVWTTTDPLNTNRRFVREDNQYPANGSSFTYPAIPVFTLAGVDTNKMYDPRWLNNSGKYTQLSYSWDVLADNSIQQRVKTWLKDSTFFGPYAETITFPHKGQPSTTISMSGSNGYLRLWGKPHNADIIPGGVTIHVEVANYAPSKITEGLAETVGDMNHSIFVYPASLACNHLQQDTILVRSQDSMYNFVLFVQDSTPVYTGTTELVANLTDKLRYCWDANTDDEIEDSIAATTGWDFRFGRTQYSFGDPLDPSVAKVQPQWMLNGYMVDATGAADVFGRAFQATGLLKVETDSANAALLLTPTPQNNGELSLDTVVSVVVHDGHTGISRKTYAVRVNVQPYVVTDTLPAAKEDVDYNVTMLDTTHAILANDPNPGDEMTYYLVYRDSALNTSLLDQTLFFGIAKVDSLNAYLVRRDNYYYGTTACKFADVPMISANLTTPSWLHINPVSGILFGTPGLNDAPHSRTSGNAPDTVTVVVRDPHGLVTVKQLILDVDSTNHTPTFTNEPAVFCELVGDTVSQDLVIKDIDLGRFKPFNDTLKITSTQAGVTITPSVIAGTGDNVMKTATVTVHMAFTNPIGGQVVVVIRVTDAGGAYTDRKILVNISRKTTWRMDLTVGNNNGATQQLTFGAGYRATRTLDADYCENALPPIPPRDVFDARWELTDTTGTVASVRDFRDSTLQATSTYQGLIQAGGNNSIENYPVYIIWNKKSVPTGEGAFHLKDRVGGLVFDINMATATGFLGPQVQIIPVDADVSKLLISNTQVTGFYVVHEPSSSVSGLGTAPVNFELAQNYPNPFNPTTVIRFGIPTEQHTRLEVIDVMGRVIATLVNDKMSAGTYNVTWDGMDHAGNVVGSGVYFYRLTAGNFVEMKQMSLLK